MKTKQKRFHKEIILESFTFLFFCRLIAVQTVLRLLILWAHAQIRYYRYVSRSKHTVRKREMFNLPDSISFAPVSIAPIIVSPPCLKAMSNCSFSLWLFVHCPVAGLGVVLFRMTSYLHKNHLSASDLQLTVNKREQLAKGSLLLI